MKKDESWKKFFGDNKRYADIINGIGCNGERIVKPEDLQELDTFSNKKIRDLLRRVAFGINFAIIGIENQDEVDYKLPFRVLYYEVAQYQTQASAIYRNVRERNKEKQSDFENKKKTKKKLRAGEYLYGFRKEDRFHPLDIYLIS